jgi:hypothetical protein
METNGQIALKIYNNCRPTCGEHICNHRIGQTSFVKKKFGLEQRRFWYKKEAKNHFLARQLQTAGQIAIIIVGLHVGNTSVITELAKLHL